MNRMILVEQERVVTANQNVSDNDPKSMAEKLKQEGYRQCLKDLDLFGYDPEEEQKKINEIRSRFYGEEDDMK